MPDFHQPDDTDRARSPSGGGDGWAHDVPTEELRRRAANAGIDGASAMSRERLVAAVGDMPPSSRNDPNAPHPPKT